MYSGTVLIYNKILSVLWLKMLKFTSFRLPVCNLSQVKNKKREHKIYTTRSVKKRNYNKNNKNILVGTRKAPGALDPAVVLPPRGCKMCYGYSR